MKFTILLPPKAQKRARNRAVTSGGKTFSMTYKDKGQRQEENKLITLIYEHRPPEPLQGPLALGVRVYLPIPQSKPKKWHEMALTGHIRPTTRPDLDNCIKNLKDVCNGIFWGDDKQVVEYLPGTGKYYDDGGGPRWEIEILTLEEYQVSRKEQGIETLGTGSFLDSTGPPISSAKGKVTFEMNQAPGRLF